MIRMSGRFRHQSTQIPAGKLIRRRFEIRIRARISPKISEKTIATAAISMLMKKPSHHPGVAETERQRRLDLPLADCEHPGAQGLGDVGSGVQAEAGRARDPLSDWHPGAR